MKSNISIITSRKMLSKKISVEKALKRLVAFDFSEKTEAFYEELCRETGKDLRKELPTFLIDRMILRKWLEYMRNN